MGTGAITGYIDVAQLVLYAFWIFFFTLIFWLHRETKREGYPLEQHGENKPGLAGWPDMPPPKTFVLPHGQGTRTVPRTAPEPQRHLALKECASGFPVEPTGNPMADGLGAASWAIRPQAPDLTHEGVPKIQPLRRLPDWTLEERDPDPRGQPVYGVDGELGGTVVDVWMDLSEPQIRYLEVEVGASSAAPAPGGLGGDAGNPAVGGQPGAVPGGAPSAARRVLLPINFARISGRDGSVRVKSITSKHFADVPVTANPDQVTLQEEDQITGYYGGGHLYALPSRTEPLL
jgi:photosynthetic reaction center H subunit